MASYVVTGVSRGLGVSQSAGLFDSRRTLTVMKWEFLRQLSADESNQVIGIVRDKTSTEKRVSEELAGRTNITILQGDMTEPNTLKVHCWYLHTGPLLYG